MGCGGSKPSDVRQQQVPYDQKPPYPQQPGYNNVDEMRSSHPQIHMHTYISAHLQMNMQK